MDKIVSKINDKINEKLKPKMVTIQKYKPFFITNDDVKHEGINRRWCIIDRLNCSVPQYMMIGTMDDGYIEDENRVMHLLSNVKSIEWKLMGEDVVEDTFPLYQIFVTTEELQKN